MKLSGALSAACMLLSGSLYILTLQGPTQPKGAAAACMVGVKVLGKSWSKSWLLVVFVSMCAEIPASIGFQKMGTICLRGLLRKPFVAFE